METYFFISVISNIAILGLGIIIGRYIERVCWNDLIQQGIIPAPKKG